MTSFRLIAPPKDRGPVMVFVVAIVAALAGAVVLTHFVDALHVSIARGEAMRAAHRVVPATDFRSGEQVMASLAPQQGMSR